MTAHRSSAYPKTGCARITERCHAEGCSRAPDPWNGLCCRECWGLVPTTIRAWVLRTAGEWLAGKRRRAGSAQQDRLKARVLEAARAVRVVVAKRRERDATHQGRLYG